MRNKVYLAGGMTSGWQDRIVSEFKGEYTFFDPRSHLLDTVKEYTVWDIHYVKNCDILFGYMEESNPSGYGLSLEIGYASALGKTVILVDERSPLDDQFQKHYKFIRSVTDIHFDKLEDGIDMLRSLSRGVI
jgi:nucleoside 2-deoxyribosyltransferase